MIRENQAIRANLRIDSRESGHLSAINIDPWEVFLAILKQLCELCSIALAVELPASQPYQAAFA